MRGQLSVELLVLFGALMIALIGIAAYLPQSASSAQGLREAQVAQSSVDMLARTADRIYLQGDGAQADVWIELPPSMDYTGSFIGSNAIGGGWAQNKTVGIRVRGQGDFFARSNAPLCGRFPAQTGRGKVRVQYNASGTAHVTIGQSC